MAINSSDAVECKMPIEALCQRLHSLKIPIAPWIWHHPAFIEATNQKEEDFSIADQQTFVNTTVNSLTNTSNSTMALKTYSKNSTPEDLTIFFGGYWDDDYGNIEERYNQDNKTVSTPIEWLRSPRLHRRRPSRWKQTSNSTFLTSLYDELYDMSDLRTINSLLFLIVTIGTPL